MVCSFFLLTVNLANVYMGAAMLNVEKTGEKCQHSPLDGAVASQSQCVHEGSAGSFPSVS